MKFNKILLLIIFHIMLNLDIQVKAMDVPDLSSRSMPPRIALLLEKLKVNPPRQNARPKFHITERSIEKYTREKQFQDLQSRCKEMPFSNALFGKQPQNLYQYLNNLRLLTTLLFVQHEVIQKYDQHLYSKQILTNCTERFTRFIKQFGRNLTFDKNGLREGSISLEDPETIAWIYKNKFLTKIPLQQRDYKLIFQAFLTKHDELHDYARYFKFSMDTYSANKQYEKILDELVNWTCTIQGSSMEKFYSSCIENGLHKNYGILLFSFKELLLEFNDRIIKEEKNGTFNDVKQTGSDIWYKQNVEDYTLMYNALYSNFCTFYAQLVKEIKRSIDTASEIPEKHKQRVQESSLKNPLAEYGFTTNLPEKLPEYTPGSVSSVLPPTDAMLYSLALLQFNLSNTKQSEKSNASNNNEPEPSSISSAVKHESIIKQDPPSCKEELSQSSPKKEDNEYLSRFDDPEQSTTAYVFKTKPQNPVNNTCELPLTYEYKTVSIWFEDPVNALKNLGYNNYRNSRAKYFREAAWAPAKMHAFPLEIDKVINLYGEFSQTNATTYEICIPGMLIYPEKGELEKKYPQLFIRYPGDGKRVQTGVFRYIFNHKNICFHRMFEPMAQKDMLTYNWNQNPEFKNQAFPPLS